MVCGSMILQVARVNGSPWGLTARRPGARGAFRSRFCPHERSQADTSLWATPGRGDGRRDGEGGESAWRAGRDGVIVGTEAGLRQAGGDRPNRDGGAGGNGARATPAGRDCAPGVVTHVTTIHRHSRSGSAPVPKQRTERPERGVRTARRDGRVRSRWLRRVIMTSPRSHCTRRFPRAGDPV